MTALILFLCLITWLFADFYFGKREQQKNCQPVQYPLRSGEIQFMNTGCEFFSALKKDLQQAEHHIHIQFFIFRNDKIGREISAILKDKARRGVKVRLLIDLVGSMRFPKKARAALKQAGVAVAVSQKPRWPYFFYTLNRRNHRKIVIIDGKIGYMGGYNVGDEYLGKDPHFGDWRDYHLRFFGDGVQDLQKQFLVDWKRAKGKTISEENLFPTLPRGNVPFYFFSTDGCGMEEWIIGFLNKAKYSILIGTPYYIPGEKVQNAMLAACRRGVRVQLLVPLKEDHLFVHDASYPYFRALIRAGCEIFLFYQGFYHAKVFLIDEQICDVGTANFDRRSFALDQEINCLLYDRKMIEKIKAVLIRDMRRSEKLTMKTINERTLIQRGKEKIGFALKPFL